MDHLSSRIRIVALASALGAGMALASPASAQFTSPVTVIASGLRGGTCMDVRAGGNDMLLWQCHGAANQQFRFRSGSYGQIMVQGRCLSTSGGSGTSLVAAACQNIPAQRWAFGPNGRLNNEQGWCADVERGGGQGSRVIAYQCNGGGNQQWTMAEFQFGRLKGAGVIPISCTRNPIICGLTPPDPPPGHECLRDPQRCFGLRPVYGIRSLRF